MYDDGAVTSTQAPAKRSRLSQTTRDMAISLAVLAVPLALLMGFCRPAPRDAPTVDPASTFRAAARLDAFPVRVPQPLPAGWRATNAALRSDAPASVRVSYLTSEGRYVQLLQTQRSADVVLPEELGTGRRRGSESIGGADWHRYGGRRDGESALVLLEPKVTVIVVGDASAAQLTALARSLR